MNKKIRNKKILVFLVSFSFVFLVFNFTSALVCPSTGQWDGSSGVCIPIGTGLPDPASQDPMITVAMNVMDWILAVVGMIAIIAFAISGIQYLLSAGNENIIETAKRNMLWSIVGVIVALSGLIIINFINSTILGGSVSSDGNDRATWDDPIPYTDPDTGELYDYSNPSPPSPSNNFPTDSNSNSNSGTWTNPDTGQEEDYTNPSSPPSEDSPSSGTWTNPDTGEIEDYTNNSTGA